MSVMVRDLENWTLSSFLSMILAQFYASESTTMSLFYLYLIAVFAVLNIIAPSDV